MNTLLDWWGFIWQLYVSTLQSGAQLGGLAMVLIWVMATAAAFAALIVAPVVFVSKLVAFAFMLAFKAALVLLFAGSAIEMAKAIEHHQADHKAKVVQLQPPPVTALSALDIAPRQPDTPVPTQRDTANTN